MAISLAHEQTKASSVITLAMNFCVGFFSHWRGFLIEFCIYRIASIKLCSLSSSDTSKQNLTRYQASILSIVFAKKTIVKAATSRSAWEDCQYSDISSMQF